VSAIGSGIAASRSAALEVLTGLQLHKADVAEQAKRTLAAAETRRPVVARARVDLRDSRH